MTESETIDSYRHSPPAWPKDALRIAFGVIWAIDASLKWLPGFKES